MPTRSRKLQEIRYTKEFAGFPCLAAVSQDEVVVADWSGKLYRVTLAPTGVKAEVFVAGKVGVQTLVCNELRSLAVAANPLKCAVATRGQYAAVWETTGRVVKVDTQNGSVSSVAWFDAGDHLLLGTGAYSFGQQARIEVWSISKEEPTLVAATALPGTCVDAVTHCTEGEMQIVCFTGMRGQNQGFLCGVDTNSLRPQWFVELPFALVGRVECTEDLVILSHAGAVRAIRREDGKEKWVQDLGAGSAEFAYDPEHDQVLLSDGKLLSARNGRVIEQWPPLEDCCGLAARPEGGFVGVSKAGVIGVWT
jgi:hypothetical protein